MKWQGMDTGSVNQEGEGKRKGRFKGQGLQILPEAEG